MLVIVTYTCILCVAKIWKKARVGITGSLKCDGLMETMDNIPTHFVPWVADTLVILIKRLLLLALFVCRFPFLAGFVV